MASIEKKVVHRIWDTRDADVDLVSALAEALNVREPVSRILVGRDVRDIDTAKLHLHGQLDTLPDPFMFKGMDKAVERIEAAIRNKEQIVVWGDYDVDGISSTALLTRFFAAIPYPIEGEIPKRLEDGYGLKEYSVKELSERGVNLVIAVDNGINSIDEIRLAKEHGMDVIVIDHHEPSDELPPAVAIVNPKQEGCGFPQDDLAAVGLTFMLAAALRRHLVECGLMTREQSPNLKELLDIVALGTVADLVPLRGVNRLFVRYGLPELSRTRRAGILALKEVAKLDPDGDVDSYAVGFQLAPRLNAGGRIGDAKVGVKLLVTDELAEARQYAQMLDKRNALRRGIQERTTQEAVAMVERDKALRDAPALIISKYGWHEGVIGLVASKLVDLFHKPAIMIALSEEGEGHASCRSVKALHIQEALATVSHHLVRFGGHAMAAGFTIRAEKLDSFRDELLAYIGDHLTEEDYIPRITTDGSLPISEIDYELVDQIGKLAPYGITYPAPVFCDFGVEVVSARLLKGKHWKLALSDGLSTFDSIAFNMPGHEIRVGQKLDIAYVPEYNTYAGATTIQLRLRDLRWTDSQPE